MKHVQFSFFVTALCLGLAIWWSYANGVIIMLGLAIGAMFVRALTVYLVPQGRRGEFAHLEHSAHYAIRMQADGTTHSRSTGT